MRRSVVVNLVSGDTIRGRRLLSWPWMVRLDSARYHQYSRTSVPSMDPVGTEMDGRVLIPRSQVAWIQVIG